jgi:hypothetical protein
MAKQPFYKNKRFQIQVYGVLSVILLLVFGYFTYTNTMKMLDMRSQAASYENLHSSLTVTENRIEEEYLNVKDENRELSQQIRNELQLVFPKNENHTVLTRTLDQLANDLHRSLEPFMINNLQYMSPQEAEDDGFLVLPFKMTIHSSYDNFFAFLRYIQNSGSLNDQTRLIDMPSIVINFVTPAGGEGNISGTKEINFNVSANAYFRSPEQ